MISGKDYRASVALGMAATAMEYHARNGSGERRQHAIALMKEAADALGFDLVKRKTPAEAHEAALAARRAEDGPERIDDLEWSR